jgi:hypothetical protein
MAIYAQFFKDKYGHFNDLGSPMRTHEKCPNLFRNPVLYPAELRRLACIHLSLLTLTGSGKPR